MFTRPFRTRRTRQFVALVALTLALAASPDARAATHQFTLHDLATFSSFSSDDPTQTFRGTGYVGMIDDRWGTGQPTWAHVLGLETDSLSRTLMQVDLGSLTGQRVVSATLRFLVLDGDEAGTNTVLVQGFDTGDGELELAWRFPRESHSSALGTATAGQESRIDITGALQYSLDHEQRWLGLHLQSVGTKNLYTMTHDYPALLSPDRAQVRIDVVTAPVPEPSTWALMLGGGVAAVGWARRRARTAE